MTRTITLAGAAETARLLTPRFEAAGFDLHWLGRGQPEPDRLDVVFLTPKDLLECEALLFEEQRFARREAAPRVIIISATLSPRFVRALRGRVPKTIALVDAPLVGSPRQIGSGQGSFLVGAGQAEFDGVKPVLAALARSVELMGEFGAGSAAKALRDCFAAATSAMTRSALDWAGAQGIEEGRLVRLLQTTFDTRNAAKQIDPAALVVNTLPGDEAGVTLVRSVETALDTALKDVHLVPPRGLHPAPASRPHTTPTRSSRQVH